MTAQVSALPDLTATQASALKLIRDAEHALFETVPWDQFETRLLVLHQQPDDVLVITEHLVDEGDPVAGIQASIDEARLEADAWAVGPRPLRCWGLVLLTETWHQRGGEGRVRRDARRAHALLADGCQFELLRVHGDAPIVRWWQPGDTTAPLAAGYTAVMAEAVLQPAA